MYLRLVARRLLLPVIKEQRMYAIKRSYYEIITRALTMLTSQRSSVEWLDSFLH